jgi:hypothetical protein
MRAHLRVHDNPLHESTVRKVEGKEDEKINVDGALWSLVQRLPVRWELAPDDHRCGQPDRRLVGRPSHLHASFQLGKHDVHVDFVRFVSWGPLSGTEEFLVFVDGVLQGRGGLFAHPPAGLHRNWPLAIAVEDQLLLIDTYGRGDDISTFAEPSLWEREKATPTAA